MTEGLAFELKWALFNDMWAVVNSAKAWWNPKKKAHKDLVQKAAEDSQRAGKHAKRAEEMGIMSGDAIRTLRAFAAAAANEVSILSVHGGEFDQKFDKNAMLGLESTGVRNDALFVNKGWETMIDAIKLGAAHIYYVQKGLKEEATIAKGDMDRRMTSWAAMAKTNIRDRDAFNEKQAREAAQKAAKDAEEAQKAKEKADKKALQVRHQMRKDLGKKAEERRADKMQHGFLGAASTDLGATPFPGRGRAEPGLPAPAEDFEESEDEADDLVDQAWQDQGGEEEAEDEAEAAAEGEVEIEASQPQGEKDFSRPLSALERVQALLEQAEQREAAARQEEEPADQFNPLQPEDFETLEELEKVRAQVDREELEENLEIMEAEARAAADDAEVAAGMAAAVSAPDAQADGEDDFEAVPAAQPPSPATGGGEEEAAEEAEDGATRLQADFEAAAAEAEAELEELEGDSAAPEAEAEAMAVEQEAEAAAVGAQQQADAASPSAVSPPRQAEPSSTAQASQLPTAVELKRPPRLQPRQEEELRQRYLHLLTRAAEERQALEATLASIRQLEARLGLQADAAAATEGIDLRGGACVTPIPRSGLLPVPKHRMTGPPRACKAGSRAVPPSKAPSETAKRPRPPQPPAHVAQAEAAPVPAEKRPRTEGDSQAISEPLPGTGHGTGEGPELQPHSQATSDPVPSTAQSPEEAVQFIFLAEVADQEMLHEAPPQDLVPGTGQGTEEVPLFQPQPEVPEIATQAPHDSVADTGQSTEVVPQFQPQPEELEMAAQAPHDSVADSGQSTEVVPQFQPQPEELEMAAQALPDPAPATSHSTEEVVHFQPQEEEQAPLDPEAEVQSLPEYYDEVEDEVLDVYEDVTLDPVPDAEVPRTEEAPQEAERAPRLEDLLLEDEDLQLEIEEDEEEPEG